MLCIYIEEFLLRVLLSVFIEVFIVSFYFFIVSFYCQFLLQFLWRVFIYGEFSFMESLSISQLKIMLFVKTSFI